MSVPNAHAQPVAEVASALQTDLAKGLSAAEVEKRRAESGWNELKAARGVPLWRRILNQFRDVLVLLLLAAAGISAVVWFVEHGSGLPYESIAILAIVVLNTVLSLVQEGKAEQALAALRKMSAPEVTLIRDGQQVRVPSRDVVPGDLLVLAEGDSIAADARVIEAVSLRTLEAALTGESSPVEKTVDAVDANAGLGDRHDMLFSGTAVSAGHGRAIVTATGMETELGHIAGMLEKTEEQLTPLQRDLDRTGKQLGLAVMVIAAIVVATLLMLHGLNDTKQIVQILLFGVALAVAAAPEGLAAVVTVVLTLGVIRMAGRGAIVRKLPAVETLGSATVIASDKTGTLTKNEMAVRAIVTPAGRTNISDTAVEPATDAARGEAEQLLTAAALANNAEVSGEKMLGDPTETALLVAAQRAGLNLGELKSKYPRTGETPFSSERKRMSTVHNGPDGQVLFAKGGANQILEISTHALDGELTEEKRKAILQASEELAASALRTLGIARGSGTGESGLTFLGLIGMIDPPRPEAAEAVAKARAAGIRPIMITGDHPATATAIAREVGIAAEPKVVTGEGLNDLSTIDADVYARVNPEHKLRIVQTLQKAHAVVAMTGDGVNDAPALKAADIGVAMGITGTDVSKEAADLVLTDDNFATIVAAVEEGRAVFDNIRKFLRYLLSSNIGEVLTIFFGVVLAGPLGLSAEGGFVLPLLATQILWINLITDGAPALALGADKAAPDLMQRKPRPRSEGVIDRRMGYGIVIIGLAMATGTLYRFDAALPGGWIEGTGTLDYGRTMAFTTLMLFQVFNAFNCRSDERSAFRGLFENPLLHGAALLSVGLHVLVLYVPFLQTAFSTVPISAADWFDAALTASSILAVSEAMKWTARAGFLRVT